MFLFTPSVSRWKRKCWSCQLGVLIPRIAKPAHGYDSCFARHPWDGIAIRGKNKFLKCQTQPSRPGCAGDVATSGYQKRTRQSPRGNGEVALDAADAA